MDTKKIIYHTDGELKIVIPAPKWLEKQKGEQNEIFSRLAKKTVPKGVEWRIVDDSDIPNSRNYRDAWIDNGDNIDVDLNKSKVIQKKLIIQKAYQRLLPDEWGNFDLTKIKDEIDNLDIDSSKDLTELYNKWPSSIETRKNKREYVIKK